MKTVNRARMNWYGIKPLVRGLTLMPVVNPLVLAAAKALLPKRQASRLPVARVSVPFAVGDGAAIEMFEPQRCDVAKDLYWGGGRRCSQADQWAVEAAMALAADAGLFLDIGSYSGLFALAVARANPSILARTYEIVPENYLMLVRNVVCNGLADRIDARLVGLGDVPGSLRLPVRMGLTQAPSSMSLETRFADGIDVAVSTLDRELAGVAGRVVAKLDVEGFEPHVLRGGRDFLARVKPDMVCEVLTSADTGAALAAILQPLGYRAWLFTDAGLRPHPDWTASREGRDWLISCADDATLRRRLGRVPML